MLFIAQEYLRRNVYRVFEKNKDKFQSISTLQISIFFHTWYQLVTCLIKFEVV